MNNYIESVSKDFMDTALEWNRSYLNSSCYSYDPMIRDGVARNHFPTLPDDVSTPYDESRDLSKCFHHCIDTQTDVINNYWAKFTKDMLELEETCVSEFVSYITGFPVTTIEEGLKSGRLKVKGYFEKVNPSMTSTTTHYLYNGNKFLTIQHNFGEITAIKHWENCNEPF